MPTDKKYSSAAPNICGSNKRKRKLLFAHREYIKRGVKSLMINHKIHLSETANIDIQVQMAIFKLRKTTQLATKD